MTAKHTTAEAFSRDVLQSEKPVLVDFWAPWCSPCRAIGASLDALAVEHQEKFEIYKVNVDEYSDLARQYEIRSIPELKVFVGGEIVKSFGGAMSKSMLEMHMAPYIK